MNYEKLIFQMLDATQNTLLLFLVTLVFSLPLGMIICAGRRSKHWLVSLPFKLYILILRGTPLMLQLLFVFYALPPLFGIVVDRLPAAMIAFSLNYAAYFAEIYRGGIESVAVGQYEASQVLGLSRAQTFFRIVLPQVSKNILPAMGNEFITLVKDTSLAQVIAVSELLKVTNDWVSSSTVMIPYVIAAAFYLIMNAVVTQCFNVAEKRLSYYH